MVWDYIYQAADRLNLDGRQIDAAFITLWVTTCGKRMDHRATVPDNLKNLQQKFKYCLHNFYYALQLAKMWDENYYI